MVPDTKAADYVNGLLDDRYPRPVTEYRGAESWSEPEPLLDMVSGLPVVSRETWITLRDPHHYCARCPICVWFISIEADANARPWQKRHFVREGDYRWASVGHALEWFYLLRLDGYAMGTLGEALAKLGRLGTRIMVGGKHDHQKAIEQAQDAILVERALGTCYQGRSRRGLSRAERMYCLFETTARSQPAHKVAKQLRERNPEIEVLTGPAVAQIAAKGRDEVYWSLRACEAIPRRSPSS
jgi:hypothetical protein